MTPAEVYNLRHSVVRSVVERTIGRLKAKFPILKYGFESGLDVMKDIITTCIILHNFCIEVEGDSPLPTPMPNEQNDPYVSVDMLAVMTQFGRFS